MWVVATGAGIIIATLKLAYDAMLPQGRMAIGIGALAILNLILWSAIWKVRKNRRQT